MDEILIEDKRYVSSKRAAKVTGYAKDYIGQLCREGRVPARLVGRSWYVLESAIHDHRFGNPEPKNELKTETKQTATSDWDAPRYEAAKADILPSVNRLRDENPAASSSADAAAPQPLNDAWKAWFDRVIDTEVSTPEDDTMVESPEEMQSYPAEPARAEEDIEVAIPIRTVYDLPPEDLLPRHMPRVVEESVTEEVKTVAEPEIQMPQGMRRGTVRMIQTVGVVVAMAVATLAVIGTGYFDRYIISANQVGLLAGVSTYNK